MTAADVPGAGSEGRDGLGAAIEALVDEGHEPGEDIYIPSDTCAECGNSWPCGAEQARRILAARPPADEGQGTLGEALSDRLRDQFEAFADSIENEARVLRAPSHMTQEAKAGWEMGMARAAHLARLVAANPMPAALAPLAARAADHAAEVEQD